MSGSIEEGTHAHYVEEEDETGNDGNDGKNGKSGKKKSNLSLMRLMYLASPERHLIIMGSVSLFIAVSFQMMVPAFFGALINTIAKAPVNGTRTEIDESQAELTHVCIYLFACF